LKNLKRTFEIALLHRFLVLQIHKKYHYFITFLKNFLLINVSDITTKFRITAMSATASLQTILRTKCVGRFMIYLHTKFHLPGSNSSVLINKQTSHFRTGAMLLSYIKQNSLVKSCIPFEYSLAYNNLPGLHIANRSHITSSCVRRSYC
jgi:hypothetical protein